MIPYIGGKSYLSGWIISNFPEDYREMQYCEVFGGGGWVLFKKDPSILETYNDLNKNLVNLFRIIRDKYPDIEHRLQWTLHSREMYAEAKEKLKNDEYLDEVEKAMYYAIDRVQSFSGRGGWAYQVTAERVVSGKWLPFIKRLEVINARLKRVQIESLDFEQCIRKYDGQNTLFYLDPPYVDAEQYYDAPGVKFREPEHIRLAELLRGIQGKFILSYYENERVRKWYKGFEIMTKGSVKHSQGCTGPDKRKTKDKTVELLIRNY